MTNHGASSPADDIYLVTSPNVNYDFTLHLSDADMSSDTDTLGIPSVSAMFSTSDVEQGLAGGGVFTVIGTANINVPASQCTQVVYLCVNLTEGTGANYTDSDPSDTSNVACDDISARKTCFPGEHVTGHCNLF